MKSKRSDRIRCIAAVGTMVLVLLGSVASALAVSQDLPVDITINYNNWTAEWTDIGDDSDFNIDDAEITVGGDEYSDAFDDAFTLKVDGVEFENPDGNIYRSGNTLKTDTVTLSGLQTTIEYYFVHNRPAVRLLYSFYNPGSSSVSVPVIIGGELGSDDDTTMQMTSDGDQTLENTDYWYFSNDSGTVGGEPSDPVFMLSRFFEGAKIIPTPVEIPDDGSDYFSEQYNITVQPGETVRILVFCQISASNADAQAGAVDFESLDAALHAGLLSGLTPDEISEIVNGEPPEPEEYTVPVMGFIGEFIFIGFLGIFGITSLRKRKKIAHL